MAGSPATGERQAHHEEEKGRAIAGASERDSRVQEALPLVERSELLLLPELAPVPGGC